MLREADKDILVSSNARGAFDQAIRIGRLKKLERLGLAPRHGAAHWRLAPDLAGPLRRLGQRGALMRTMQRAYAADRKSAVAGTRVSAWCTLGGGRLIKTN